MAIETKVLDSVEGELAMRIVAARPAIDTAAEAALYRCLAPRIRLYGRRHLRDDAAADDLVQQVMVMAIEKLRAGEVREPQRIASFVLGTCRMTILELRRGWRRRDALLQVYGADPAGAETEAPQCFDPERVARCLEALPERERSIVLLSFFGEQPASQVGQALGLSAGNVRVILHRAVQRLRSCVQGLEER